jgi:cysteine desulfurase
MIKMPLYLDSAATNPVDPRVKEAMLPYFDEIFGNASSNHVFGKKAKFAIENARIQVANIINADSSEIYFTSGSTESINWALKGYLEANPEKGNHIITVKTEHKAVLNTCEYLETKGYEVTYLGVDENGLINLKELEDSITNQTSMICVMYVNNEIGIIQDIPAIGKITKENKIIFFCDATQAVGKIEVDIVNDNIDLLCFSGHKMNGPKGIGALYIKSGINITPLIHGGGQEKGLRGGTYNTPLIAGFGKACEISFAEFELRVSELLKKREEIESNYETKGIGIVNFKNASRAPHIISISLIDFDSEDFLMINEKYFVASSGSACNSSISEESHVLRAMKRDKPRNVVRISISAQIFKE